MDRRPGKRTAAEAEQTRRKLIDAALVVFAEKGFEGASLRDISSAAGVTHSLIRHHFGTKQKLWEAMVDAFVAALLVRGQSLLEQSETAEPLELLRAFARNLMQVAAQDPDFMRVVMNDCRVAGPRLDYLVERILPLHRAIDPIFHAAQRQGEVRHFTADSLLLCLLSLGAFPFAMGAFHKDLTQIDLSSPEARSAHADLVIRVLFGNNND